MPEQQALLTSAILGQKSPKVARSTGVCEIVLRFFLLLLMVAAQPLAARAQTLEDVNQDLRIAPTASVFLSVTEFGDLRDRSFGGYGIRTGLVLSAYLDVTANIERWPDLGAYSAWAAQLEAHYYPLGRPLVAPVVLLGAGYFKMTPRTAFALSSDNGRSAAIGVGLDASIWKGLGVRTEALFRQDGNGLNDQLRILLTYAAERPQRRAGLPDARADAVLYWMFPVRGPYEFVEPGWAVRFTTPVSRRFASSMTVGIFHWEGAGYDSRAAVIMPGAEWSRASEGRLSLRAGPALTVMLEGPDGGVTFGGHAEASISAGVWDIPVTVGSGWLWLSRHETESDPGEDQFGLMFFAGVHM